MLLLPRRAVGPVGTVALAAVAFAGLADAATEGDGPARIDPHVATDVLAHRSGALTAAARTLTFVGSEPVVGVLALVLVIVLLERRDVVRAVLATLAMGAAAALTVGVKLVVGRPRPGPVDRLGPADGSFSFPSGHTLSSAVLIGVVCLLLVPVLHHCAVRVAAYAGSAVLAIGIGASRVYLGYHWATDVLSSWVLAAAVLALVRLADRILDRPARSGDDQVAATRVAP